MEKGRDAVWVGGIVRGTMRPAMRSIRPVAHSFIRSFFKWVVRRERERNPGVGQGRSSGGTEV